MRVVFNEIQHIKVFLDGRRWTDAWQLMNKALESVYEQINPHYRALKNLSSVSIGPLSLEITSSTPPEKTVDEELLHKNKKAVIFIDEAQTLKDIGKVLAYYYDNTKSFQFIISGSEVGLMNALFETNAPLFGRLREEITLTPLSAQAAQEFLRRGFEQEGRVVDEEEIADAVEQLDGPIGWLTYYGYLRRTLQHHEAIRRLKNDAKALLMQELTTFLHKKRGEKRRYKLILKALSIRSMTWEEIHKFLEVEERKKISKSRLKAYLDALLAHSFIIKNNERYELADPLVALIFSSV
jgi:predicted AAA+ superfamily ATPase